MEVGDIFYDTEINQYYVVAQIFEGATMKRKYHDIENDKAVVQVGGIY